MADNQAVKCPCCMKMIPAGADHCESCGLVLNGFSHGEPPTEEGNDSRPVVVIPRRSPGEPSTEEGKDSSNGTAEEEIECPYCAERIKRKVVKCKHCGSDLGVKPRHEVAGTPKTGALPILEPLPTKRSLPPDPRFVVPSHRGSRADQVVGHQARKRQSLKAEEAHKAKQAFVTTFHFWSILTSIIAVPLAICIGLYLVQKDQKEEQEKKEEAARINEALHKKSFRESYDEVMRENNKRVEEAIKRARGE